MTSWTPMAKAFEHITKLIVYMALMHMWWPSCTWLIVHMALKCLVMEATGQRGFAT